MFGLLNKSLLTMNFCSVEREVGGILNISMLDPNPEDLLPPKKSNLNSNLGLEPTLGGSNLNSVEVGIDLTFPLASLKVIG